MAVHSWGVLDGQRPYLTRATRQGPSSWPVWAPRVTEATGWQPVPPPPGKGDEGRSRQRAEQKESHPALTAPSCAPAPGESFVKLELPGSTEEPARPSNTFSPSPLSPDCTAQINPIRDSLISSVYTGHPSRKGSSTSRQGRAPPGGARGDGRLTCSWEFITRNFICFR